MGRSGNRNSKYESAARIREIRKNSGFTQEEFAELLDISLSAYKKIESGENRVSVNCLEKINQELHVSSDYILFGKQDGLDGVWNVVLNVAEEDKAKLLLRLFHYFVQGKPGRYFTREVQTAYEKRLEEVLKEMKI